jgi:predicted SAM-dependent methyltransferase
MSDIKINIGSGRWRHPGWISINLPGYGYEDDKNYRQDNILIDITKIDKLPFDDDSVSLFYCSMVFEHLSNEVVAFICKDIYRCLKSGGGFRVLVPNIEQAYYDYTHRLFQSPWMLNYYRYKEHKYLRNPYYLLKLFYSKKDVDLEEFRKNLHKMEMTELFDYYTLGKKQEDPHDHINWYNYEKLNKILSKAGFTNIKKRNPGDSHFEELRGNKFDFNKKRNKISLIVEAIK